MQHSEPMPAKVVDAISAIMAEVPKLNKGERNSHGNYNFASIDDFLEAVRPLMAKHKLVITADEDDFEVIGEGRDSWLRMRFAFAAHCGGETYGPMRRSIMIMSKMGSQAFGAGQSYAEKQVLRSLFKIATGEGANIDADSHPQEALARTSSPAKVIDEPEEGWGAWALGLIGHLEAVENETAVEAARTDETTKRRINALRTIDGAQYAAIGKAFQDARARLASPQKRAA